MVGELLFGYKGLERAEDQDVEGVRKMTEKVSSYISTQGWPLRCHLLFALFSFLVLQGLFLKAASAQSCSVSMTNVAFGGVDVTTGSPVDIVGTLQINCSGFSGGGGGRGRVCLNIGAGSSGDATSRIMGGPGSLRYDLYTDAARTTVWGSWQTGYKSPGVEDNVSNGITNYSVYGRVLGSQQTALGGSYSSTFTFNPFVEYRNRTGAPNCPMGSSTTSTSFAVTATVLTTCSVDATNLNFGSVGVLASNVDASNTVSLACTNGTPYNVGLNAGTGVGATVANRKLSSGGSTVTYSLYTNAARTTVWGNTVGIDTVGGTGTGNTQAYTVYGRVPAQTTPAPATYTDNVVVTVTY